MPHQRLRKIESALLKKLKLWPAVGLLGMRQTGKSTLLRDLLQKKIPLDYYTLDSATLRSRAETSPDSFSEQTDKLLVIDEVQKVPDLFDSIKKHIDEKKRPGKYLLSGSTAFSEKVGIRESLTGRISLLHLYPFNMSEITGQELNQYWDKKNNMKAGLSLNEFERILRNGGMPGFFHLHNSDEYSQMATQWIETTCYRDIAQIIKKGFDPELALRIYTQLANTESGYASEVASILAKDTRIVSRYLESFCQIFALLRIVPHESSTGKDRYAYPDSGLATILGADRNAILETHVLVQALSSFEAIGKGLPQLQYYKTEKNSYVPFIFSWVGNSEQVLVQICDSEKNFRKQEAANFSFLKRTSATSKKIKYREVYLYQGINSYFEDKKEFYSLRG